MRSTISRVASLLGVCVALMGISGLTLLAAAPPAALVAGSILDPTSHTFDAVLLESHDQVGVVSLTTENGHYYGYLERAQYSPGHVTAFAVDVKRNQTIEVDADEATQTLSVAEFDANGDVVAGSDVAQAIHGKVIVQ